MSENSREEKKMYSKMLQNAIQNYFVSVFNLKIHS